MFLNRPIGDSPEDNLLLQLQGMFAEYERAKLLERSRRGKRHRVEAGAISVLSRANKPSPKMRPTTPGRPALNEASWWELHVPPNTSDTAGLSLPLPGSLPLN